MVRGRAFAGLQRPDTAGQLPPCKPLLLQCAAGIPMSPPKSGAQINSHGNVRDSHFTISFYEYSLYFLYIGLPKKNFNSQPQLHRTALAKSVFLIDARVSPAQVPSQMITGDGRSAHQLLYSIDFQILNTPRPVAQTPATKCPTKLFPSSAPKSGIKRLSKAPEQGNK